VRRLATAARVIAVAGIAACAALAPRATAINAPEGTHVSETRTSVITKTRPLATGFLDPWSFRAPDQAAAFDNARRAGATFVRILLNWPDVAPGGSTMPPGFRPADPGDPRYQWATIDSEVRATAAKGFLPLIYVQGAPSWAQTGEIQRPSDGPVRPSPSALADFGSALATRYSGSNAGLPRVRYWQVWNEPNLSIELMPQSEGDRVVSPDWYRDMVNAMARAVHAVHPDNVVVAGGLAPFGGNSNDPSASPFPPYDRIHPLDFMRRMLCMSSGAKPTPTCSEKSEFDVWAHHPYTYGGPTHSAYHPDDVSIGDLGEVRRLLDAAAASGHISTRQKLAFWVTEFSYDSQPADPKGLPPDLHARWVSEALYRMWQNGVSLVTWFLIRDELPYPQAFFQSGLYYRGANGIASDKPKPALRAFRFPFVAFKQKNGAITYWGRTPLGKKQALVVEQKQGSRWARLVTPTVDRYGIFQGRVTNAKGTGSLRARLVSRSDVSLPFSLTVPADFRFCPWGSGC